MRKYSLILFAVISFSTTVFSQIGNIVIPDGHAEGIEKILLSPDGKYLYTANSQKIIMWDAKQHIQLYSFSLAVRWDISQAISSFILSNDGNYVAATGGFGVKCFSTVTGKQVLDIQGLRYSATFSADSKKIFYSGDMQDPKTYNLLSGIISVDLTSLIPELVFICTDYGNCNFKEFTELKNGTVKLWHEAGWQIADLDAKKILFTSNVDTKTDLFGSASEMRFLPLRNTNLIVAAKQNKGEIYANLIFFDAYTGRETYRREIGNNWKIISGMEGDNFLLDAGSFSEELDFIDAKSGSTIKKIDKSALSLPEGEELTTGILYSKNKHIYFNSGGDVKEMDLQTLKTSISFKREIAGFPIVTNYDYNEQNEKLRMVTDYTNYLSIDFKRMVVEKNTLLTSAANQNTEISFSSTGDTISVDEYGKAFFYVIKNSKKTNISPTLFGDSPFESAPRPNVFFGREGKYAYAIKNVNTNGGDAQTLYQINIATNISKKIAEFQHNLEIDIQQDIIAGYDKTPTSFVVKCWQLSTGKLIFTKTLPTKGEEPKLIAARAFAAKSKIAILGIRYLQVFNIADGKLLQSSKEVFLSLENDFIISHNADLIAELADEGRLSILDSTLNRKHLIQSHNGSINKAYYSPNDDLIYTAGSDNTIKIFRTATGEIIGTLYIFKDSKDYVFIDPTGRFDGTPEGMKKLYYVKDRKIVTLDKIYEKFYTPNLYLRLLNGEIFNPIDITINPSPLCKISYQELKRNLLVEDEGLPSYSNTTGRAEITVSATAEGDKIDEIRLFHNGKIVNLATRGLFVTDDATSTDSKKYTINLMPGQNSFRAIAINTQRTESKPDEIWVTYQTESGPSNTKPITPVNGGAIEKVDKNATLHLIVVGINKYQNKSMVLNYALADATAFKEELEKDAKSIITNIKTYFVTDDIANKSGITDAFGQVQQNAKPQDVFVFYYAGHGVIGKDKEFYLVPNDVSDLKNVQVELEQKGIPAKLLQQYAIDIAAQKQLFILDACQSAGAFNEMLTADGDQQKSIAVVSRSTGTHWMAASGAQQYANEFSQLGHGAFTYVLLEALKGSAAADKMITVNGLKRYLEQGVPELMKKYSGTLQYPASYGFGNDFPVEIVK